MEGKRAKAKMQRILKANKQEIMRLREMSRRRERMMARMKAKWLNNEEEGGSSNLPIVDDLQEMLAEVISKVVEEDEGKHGGRHVTRTEAEHKSNVEEALSASVRAQVSFHLCNLIKYLIFCQFVRYKIEISHVFHTHEIWIG